jgi:vacuolar-type H+-ATPase subunit I/STV1
MNRRHYDVSIHEWMMSLLLIAIGAHIFAFEDAVSQAPVRLVLETAPHEVIGFVCFIIGFFRLSALSLVNVAQEWVLDLRLWGAVLGSVVWLIMASSIIQGVVEKNVVPPPGLYMLVSQFAGDVWLIFRIARIKRHLRRR